MNREIPHEFRERWSCVIDCGTGEHIFNYHQAIKNMMDMLCVGGTLLLIIPTNNWMYHGYYQFCPDLFWELLNEKNGFKILDMTIEESKNGIDAIYRRVKYDFWYQPIEERHITKYPTQLFICAQKIAPTPPVIELQQGYYEDAWKKGSRTKKKQRKNKENLEHKSLQIQKWWNKLEKRKNAIKEIEDEKYNIDKEWERINSIKSL